MYDWLGVRHKGRVCICLYLMPYAVPGPALKLDLKGTVYVRMKLYGNLYDTQFKHGQKHLNW